MRKTKRDAPKDPPSGFRSWEEHSTWYVAMAAREARQRRRRRKG